jgi:HlyD family secretion protein
MSDEAPAVRDPVRDTVADTGAVASLRHRRRPPILWIAIASALLGALWIAFRPQPVAVDVALVDRGPVRLELVDEGRTRMHEVYEVTAPVPGRLLRVTVEPGDAVRAGEVVARLRRGASGFLDARADAEARAGVAAATARRAAAAADRGYAALEAERIARLAESKLVAVSAADLARTRLAAAQAAEAAAIAEERRARAALSAAGAGGEGGAGGEEVLVRSPAAGVVLRVPRESESVVAAGAPLVVVGDPGEVEVVAEFLSQDAVRIAPGARARVENWGGDALGATVKRIEPVARTKVSALGIEEQRANVVLRFDAPPPAPLRAQDFRVDVRVVVDEAADTLRVPLGALFRVPAGEGGDAALGWAVWRIRDDRAERVPVTVGLQDGTYRAVNSGLQPGESVVVFPSVELRPGSRVATAR